MTRKILNVSMEARKGVMKLKLVRAFIAFVVISLFVGISSAFNGQNYVESENKETTKTVDKVEVDNINEEISTKTVENEKVEEEKTEKIQNNNSFSASKDENVNNSKQEKVKTKTQSNTSTTNSKTIQENNPPVEVKTETIQENTQKVEQNNPPINNSNNDDKINSTYYSITKGNAEYSTQNECKSAGLKIQNKELDAILDWNEEHPDNPKSRVIGSSMCIVVMKDGKEHWYLHFLTVSGENLDDELKNIYK